MEWISLAERPNVMSSKGKEKKNHINSDFLNVTAVTS